MVSRKASWRWGVLFLVSSYYTNFLDNTRVLASQEPLYDPCRVQGATYGYPKEGNDARTQVHEWASIVGIACADKCYDEAVKWSSVAFNYGDREIESEEECRDLCLDTEECDTWTYWPSGVGNLDMDAPGCDICDGGKVNFEESYCFDDDCGQCGETYNFFYFFEGDFEEEIGSSCEDITTFFRIFNDQCCDYPTTSGNFGGTCELFSAQLEKDPVINFEIAWGQFGDVITGPKECNTTKWLPFLENIVPPTIEEEKNEDPLADYFDDEDNCDFCPEEKGYILDDDETYCDENTCENNCLDAYEFVSTYGTDGLGVTCFELYSFFTTDTNCCSYRTLTPTLSPTIDDSPRASDGRQCWVDHHSYGIVEDGACANAQILIVYTKSSVEELGQTQGWWDSENGGDPVPVTTYDDDDKIPFEIDDCMGACVSNDNCGGWEYYHQSQTCLLKSVLECTPTVGYSKAPDVTSGISGCIDVQSSVPEEREALDIDPDNWFLDCDQPRCTKPYFNGFFADDTLIADSVDGSSCWNKQFTPEELYNDCAQDTWIVVNGGSNALSFYLQLVNLFAPIQRVRGSRGASPLIDFGDLFEYSIIDIVFRGDSMPILDEDSDDILYLNRKQFCDIDSSLKCQESLDFQGDTTDWSEDYQNALDVALADAIYEPGATRVTLIVGQIWTNAEVVLQSVGGRGASDGWENAKTIFYGQAMIWYTCNVDGWCDLDELGNTYKEMSEKFRSDVKGVLEVGDTFCGSESFHCFFTTHAYGAYISPPAQMLIDDIAELTSQYSWAHYIDYNGFTPSEEVIDGHVTPAIILPVQQMIWNTVCEAPSSGCPEAIEMSPFCWADCHGESACISCNDWLCMNERQCDFETFDPVPWTQVFSASEIIQSKNQATGSNACFDSTQIGHLDSTKLQSPCNDECGRIWCGSTTSAWVISTLIFLVSLAVLLASHFIDVKKKIEKVTTNTSTLEIDGKGRIHSELAHDGTNITTDPPSSQIPSGSQESANVPPPPSKKEYLKSLGFARLLASQHIVIGHLYAKGATSNTYFFSFGFTWVPWFFILSGFVLTHARLNSSNPTKIDGPYKHIAKRLSTIYPMYAFGIVLSMIIRLFKGSKLPGVDVLIAQSFLLQSWVPVWTEKTLLSQCWFLSNLVLYWACFSLLFKLLHKLTLNQTCGLLLLICCLPWLVVIVPAIDSSIDMDWYSMHQFGQADSADDIWTVLLKFHPIFYLHVFVFGMLLSVLREHLKQNETEKIARVLRSVTNFGACIGYIGLILIFSIQEIKPPARKLSTRLSILLPLQGLMMLGLSPLPQTHEKKWLGQDPLALLFSYAPTWVGDVSYCQYVLQFAMYDLFPVEDISDPSFFLYLWGASILAYKAIQEPAAKFWRRQVSKSAEGDSRGIFLLPSLNLAMIIFIPPALLAAILVITKIPYSPTPRSSCSIFNATNSTGNYTTLEPFVRLSNESIDMELNWTIQSDTPMLENTADISIINPSLLFQDDDNGGLTLIRAARVHKVTQKVTDGILYGGKEVTEHILSFTSSIAMKAEPFNGDLSTGFDDSSISNWGLDASHPLDLVNDKMLSHKGFNTSWTDICEPQPAFNDEEETLFRKIVDGPEDPKLLEIPAGNKNEGTSFGLTFSSFPPASLINKKDCKWDEEAVMQMYLAPDGPSLVSQTMSQGVKLNCGDPYETEKNWIAFHHENKLYYIYSVEPHVVVHVRKEDGSCVKQYETSSTSMSQVAKRVFAIRGSATASQLNENEYLALMHTYDPSYGYDTVAYTFQAKPPFAVLRISKPLSLQRNSFPSSLSITSNKILVGYGESDERSRVLVMSHDHLEDLFSWCA